MTLPLVLIVDDNPENLTVIGELLQPGHAVRAANGGACALRLAALQPPPDLILLDVMMPDMDGYEVLAELRRRPATAEVPVIFLSALNSSADEERGLMHGAVDYITKPIRPAVLLARVRTQLELKLARDQVRDRSHWLETEVARRMDENLHGHDTMVHTLALLTRSREAGTGHHLPRMQAVVAALASHLRRHGGSTWADLAVDDLVRAVPLHDLGKVGVPDRVLLKPARLDADETAVVRSHVRLGAEALQSVLALLPRVPARAELALQVVRSHHERWDGRGYPDGLAGEQIPVPARLVAVADAFDALVSPRPWRPALSPDEARALIVGEWGQQFDPQVVDAFEACFDTLRSLVAAPGQTGLMAAAAPTPVPSAPGLSAPDLPAEHAAARPVDAH